ncbi:unnamed protein product [Anisakis simplex]|uniref:Uncharacterized protein n=1 Tax=Anisakis simplex TaxID=6269 RepID=A0A0M3J1Y6_ANISI|nr:unnamed protein product [Anisakis simplex]
MTLLIQKPDRTQESVMPINRNFWNRKRNVFELQQSKRNIWKKFRRPVNSYAFSSPYLDRIEGTYDKSLLAKKRYDKGSTPFHSFV